MFLTSFLYGVTMAQSKTQLDVEAAVLKACLTKYKYNSQNGEFFTASGESVGIKKIEITTVNKTLTALIWTSVGDDSQFSKHDLTLSILKEKSGKYELLSQTEVVEDYTMLNTFSMTTYPITSSGEEAISVTYGRDTDGDGDEVKLGLFVINSDEAKLILDYLLIDDSGDGCDVSRMEAEFSLTEETTSEYFDIQVVENTSLSNSCDENEEEYCTKKRSYKFTWNGNEYSSDN